MRLYPQVGKRYIWQQEKDGDWVNCMEGDSALVVTDVDAKIGRVECSDPQIVSDLRFTMGFEAWTNDAIKLQVDLGRKVRFRMIEA